MKRKTIKNSVEILGIGLHKGEEIKLTLKPSKNNDERGIIFKRIDVSGKNNVIKVDYRNLFDLERGTNIRNEDDVKVHTIEHFLSSLSIIGVTDILVEISGNELPILDGSSAGFVEKLLEAGIVELNEEIEPVVITEPVIFSDEKAGKYVMALPYDGFKISYTIDFNHSFLKSQYYELEVNLENYMENIAKCRTFAFDYEIDFLKKNNLALGGSLKNAVVVGANGPLNPEGLRYPDEFVRHKILDIIGDLYVLGTSIKAHIIAIKAGHYVNSRLTEMIAKKYKNCL
ncbi:MAG: UDP-3-O-acyl-N-acetylglucosamine deacetylase [Leptotrichia hofstadii]